MSRAAVDSYRHQNSYAPTMKHSPRINPGGGGGGGDHGKPPSKLLQMRDDYQRRLLKEKEEKMIHMYEDNQRRNVDRIDRLTGKGNSAGDGRYPNSKLRQPGHMQHHGGGGAGGQMGSSTSVRDFFRERRELEAKGGYIPPISHHYKQARGRTGSGGSIKKNSAGIDRAQPLAPIQARHSGVSSAPAETPFSNKPRLVKHHSGSNIQRRDDNNNTPGGGYHDEYADDSPTTNTAPSRTPGRAAAANKKAPPPSKGPAVAGPGNKRSSNEKEDKVSDFQRWQIEQTKAREDRLKKLNMRAPRGGQDSEDWGQEGEQDEIDHKQRELMEKIAAQQAELERLRREREEEEEMERREAEIQRKQQAAEKERRRKQQQEEARQQREEEARQRREDEEHRREEQKRAAAASRAKPPQQQRQQRYDSNAYGEEDDNDRYASHESSTPRVANRTTPRRPTQQHPPPQQQRAARATQPPRRDPVDEDEPVSVPGPGADFYASAVDDGSDQPGRLVACKLCGRKFADDRVAKHQAACKNAQKKRKTFDPVQMRTDGTDMAKYIRKGANTKEPKQSKKKADWRRQHEEFVNAIRYAKKMTYMESQGVALKDLPPPPPSHNPDLVPCPHCGRTFNVTAADRHIPRCKELKTRPVAKGRR